MIYTPSYDKSSNLETSSGKVNLDRIKSELRDVQSAANWYFDRNGMAGDWLNSLWPGQTMDGRKWVDADGNKDKIFPWPGASDTKTRLVRMIYGWYKTISMHTAMNMKLQAKSTRPAATIRPSQERTTLLNWQIFTQMREEWFREVELAISISGARGASVMAVDWEQERRLKQVDINTVQFAQWIGHITGQQFQQNDVSDMLEDNSYEKDLIVIVQEMSEIISTAKARSILNDLRTLRTAIVPLPYIFKNKPRIMALEPMVDVFFNPDADDLQRERWVDRVEYVTETILNDRIETNGYDPGFVKEAVKTKGDLTNDPWNRKSPLSRWGGSGAYEVYPGGKSNPDASAGNGLIELHHFKHYKLDMGVPCLYNTCFHMALDEPGWHGPDEYNHGQINMHAFRFETDDRPILSSMGIPEIAYTWEQEEKVQHDFRTDRTSLAMKPPMFTDHGDILKIKNNYVPSGLMPFRRGTEPRMAPPPPYDPGSIQISQDILQRAREYFGWFGVDLDPLLKQLRLEQLTDRTTTQFTPIISQILKLDEQFLPDEIYQAVTGGKSIRASLEQIQGEFQITAVCDLRERDNEFLKQKIALLAQIKQMDTGGVMDANDVVKRAIESVDYTLAETAIQDTGAATNKEITDEIGTLNRIIGSGMSEPLPQAGNFQLRMQTMENHLQSTDPKNPNQRLTDPSVQAVLENRRQYFQRQLAQAQHAQIGRLQVGSPFAGGGDKAPQLTQGAGAY